LVKKSQIRGSISSSECERELPMESATVTEDSPERAWEAQSWLRAETLAALAELNEQCLELLSAQARTVVPGAGAPLLREIGPLLRSLDDDARHRAAACPYLLVDAGFGDQQRWVWVSGFRVRDSGGHGSHAFFSIPGVTTVTRQVLTYAWHLTRSQNAAARMLLGMSAHCSRLIAACTLRQVLELAEMHPEWLQPRWVVRPRMWRELLLSAISGDNRALERARMRGLQVLAAEARSVLPP
jgi:hypothetical protein